MRPAYHRLHERLPYLQRLDGATCHSCCASSWLAPRVDPFAVASNLVRLTPIIASIGGHTRLGMEQVGTQCMVAYVSSI